MCAPKPTLMSDLCPKSTESCVYRTQTSGCNLIDNSDHFKRIIGLLTNYLVVKDPFLLAASVQKTLSFYDIPAYIFRLSISKNTWIFSDGDYLLLSDVEDISEAALESPHVIFHENYWINVNKHFTFKMLVDANERERYMEPLFLLAETVNSIADSMAQEEALTIQKQSFFV
ncbi:hypothetical protein O5O45_03525 [Hahella aquimaris]|uniref:hypothetical protein n=1 Tax=Hahella sp. HNIBRBA332 TaxID=3015983 RepID=UPI00273BF4F9|nr:hypothetical protein [Hahella sp. HNIBRBA332]WLQ15000.1 hypothetical protein O5O45_03525 [Hahella sp. HNIBRBA332]